MIFPISDPPSGRVSFSNVTFDQHTIDSAATPSSDFYLRSGLKQSFDDLMVEVPKPAHLDPPEEPEPLPFLALDRAVELDLTLIVFWKVGGRIDVWRF